MANVTRGLSGVEPARARADALVRRDARATILRKVRIPNSLPFLFTALKLASTLSLIGAIVAEYFGGAVAVLGRMIVQSAQRAAVRHHVGRGHARRRRRDHVLPRSSRSSSGSSIPWHASSRVDG